jgi:hypothetical protein
MDDKQQAAWFISLAVLALAVLVIAMLAPPLGSWFYSWLGIDRNNYVVAELRDLKSAIHALSTDIGTAVQHKGSPSEDVANSSISSDLPRIVSALEAISRSNQWENTPDNQRSDPVVQEGASDGARVTSPTQQVVAVLPPLSIIGAHGAESSSNPEPKSTTGASASGAVSTIPDTKILARWVQLVPSPHEFDAALDHPMQALVRAVVEGNEVPCPALHLNTPDGDSLPMTPRSNPDRKAFPVTVCQALLPRSGISKAYLPSPSSESPSYLPIPKLDGGIKVTAVAAFGDTGCRTLGPPKWKDRQACNEQSWPFQRIASRAAAGARDRSVPDLVIHLGDYTYGEVESWDVWRREFFDPARDLLEITPWIMLPGNQESCTWRENRGAQGWLLFLDQAPLTLTRSCPTDGMPLFLPPYALDVDANLRLIVLDSANAFVDENNKEQRLPIFRHWFEQIVALSTITNIPAIYPTRQAAYLTGAGVK